MNTLNICNMINKVFNINLSALYDHIIENDSTEYGYWINCEHQEDGEEYYDLIDPDNFYKHGKNAASHNDTCKVVDVVETANNGRYVIIYNLGMTMVDGLFNPMFALSEEEFWIVSE